MSAGCQRIGGCLHDVGVDVCCCDDGTCDGQDKRDVDLESLGGTMGALQQRAELRRLVREARDERDSARHWHTVETQQRKDAESERDALAKQLWDQDAISNECAILTERAEKAEKELGEMRVTRDSPEIVDFVNGVIREANHQDTRWGDEHDAVKTAFDWFWLIGYLSQKAATSATAGDIEKAMHNCISTAAALAQWHARLLTISQRKIESIEVRWQRFQDTTGVHGYMTARGPTGANHHPDRCVCQGDETTPHKHYPKPPHDCARCMECKAYTPALEYAE